MSTGSVSHLRGTDLHAAIERIASEVAAPAASSVDREARFPRESIDALRGVGALSASVPVELGGAGALVSEIARHCFALGQSCAASAMVYAMHHTQVLSVVHHDGADRALRAYLERVVREQRLIASATSEVGPGGDMRSSVCAVDATDSGFTLQKQASVLSYGAHADDILLSARRNASAAPNDQVLVLALKGQYELTNPGNWDTLGMRGTCSPGATVRTRGERWQIVPEPFGDIASVTMVPTSHILWGHLWLGIASDAVAKAQTMVRKRARQNPAVVPRAAQRLAEVVLKLQSMRGELTSAASEYDELMARGERAHFASVGYALRINNLKISASRLVAEIVTDALAICGVDAYRNDSSFSLGRQLRDAHSAALMIHNDRIVQSNEALLLVHKGT